MTRLSRSERKRLNRQREAQLRAQRSKNEKPTRADGGNAANDQIDSRPQTSASFQREEAVVAAKKANEQKHDGGRSIRTGLKVAAGIAVILTAVFTYYMWETANRQLAATDRPWLTINMQPGRRSADAQSMLPSSPYEAFSRTTPQPHFHVTYSVKNIGKSVANSVLLPVGLTFASAGLAAIKEKQRSACDLRNSVDKTGRSYDYGPVYPEQEFSVEAVLKLADATPKMPQIPDGLATDSPVVVGCIDYFSANNFRYSTTFSYQLMIPSGFPTLTGRLNAPRDQWVLLPTPGGNVAR